VKTTPRELIELNYFAETLLERGYSLPLGFLILLCLSRRVFLPVFSEILIWLVGSQFNEHVICICEMDTARKSSRHPPPVSPKIEIDPPSDIVIDIVSGIIAIHVFGTAPMGWCPRRRTRFRGCRGTNLYPHSVDRATREQRELKDTKTD
jgi:hypothetical protein